MTTCYPTVSSGVYGNSGDKMSKEYVECSGKGKKAKPAIYQALERVRDEEAAGSNPVIPTISSVHNVYEVMNTRFFVWLLLFHLK